jgi:aspartate aminotransferase-like enzyme
MVRSLRADPTQVKFVYDGERERARRRREETLTNNTPVFEDITSLEEALSKFLEEEPLPEDLQEVQPMIAETRAVTEEIGINTSIPVADAATTTHRVELTSSSTQTEHEYCVHGNILPVHEYRVLAVVRDGNQAAELQLKINCSSCPTFDIEKKREHGLI